MDGGRGVGSLRQRFCLDDNCEEYAGNSYSVLIVLTQLFLCIHFLINKENKLQLFKALQQRIKNAAKAGHCFEIDVTDMMDRCQLGDVLMEEEVQIISHCR